MSEWVSQELRTHHVVIMTTKQRRSNYSKIWWSQIQPSFQPTSFLQRIARRRALYLSLSLLRLRIFFFQKELLAHLLVLFFVFFFLFSRSFFFTVVLVFISTFSVFFSAHFFRIIFFVSSSFLLGGGGHKLVVVIPPYLQISSPLVLVWCL